MKVTNNKCKLVWLILLFALRVKKAESMPRFEVRYRLTMDGRFGIEMEKCKRLATGLPTGPANKACNANDLPTTWQRLAKDLATACQRDLTTRPAMPTACQRLGNGVPMGPAMPTACQRLGNGLPTIWQRFATRTCQQDLPWQRLANDLATACQSLGNGLPTGPANKACHANGLPTT